MISIKIEGGAMQTFSQVKDTEQAPKHQAGILKENVT